MKRKIHWVLIAVLFSAVLTAALRHARAQNGAALNLRVLPLSSLVPAPAAAGDIICGSSGSWVDCPAPVAPAPTNQLPAPGANGNQLVVVNGAWASAPVGLNQRGVTGTTDTIAPSDRGNVVTYSGTSAVAVVLPSAASFGGNFFFHVEVSCTGAPTFTPAAGTINGAASLAAPVNTIGTIYSSDNVNYRAVFTPAYLGNCR